MPGGIRNRWYFELILGVIRGITVSRNGKIIAGSSGDLLGPISDVSQPTTRQGCEQAKDFLDQAVQVPLLLHHVTLQVNSQEQLPSMGLKKLKHSDPLDDSIFSKRIGEGVLYTLY